VSIHILSLIHLSPPPGVVFGLEFLLAFVNPSFSF
jgi:hypothetical protein